MRIAFTGHRPNKLGGYGPSEIQDKVRAAIRDYLKSKLGQPLLVISGMALGVDQWAAEEALALGIKFTAAVPFIGQESMWPEESQQRYHELLGKAYDTSVICGEGYHISKMQTRNRWMVDQCDELCAIWDGTSGGTANCVRYAVKEKTPIFRIDPSEFR